uniref:LIM zinc-binding domain-containing protein n=1 Tax=Varanus komodoensis TaxID=61221 RepID=A0A8D2LCY5_VARKO
MKRGLVAAQPPPLQGPPSGAAPPALPSGGNSPPRQRQAEASWQLSGAPNSRLASSVFKARSVCQRCSEKVTSLGKDWHRPCLKCEKCGKTLTSGGHAEHEGKPYCNHPCYSALFGPKGKMPVGREGYFLCYDFSPSHTLKQLHISLKGKQN